MITIIIPFYNKANTITKTLTSISSALAIEKNKSFQYELIIVNDGSSSVEKNKLDTILLKFSNLNIITLNKINGGVSSARNYGLKYSKYSFIYFLDADDILLDNFFIYFNAKCIKNECNQLFNLKINNKIIKHFFNTKTIMTEELFSRLVNNRCLHLSNFIFSKSEIVTFDIDINVGEDLLFIYKSIINKPIIPHNENIASYLYDGKFHSSNKNGLELILNSIENKNLYSIINKSINERNYLTSMLTNEKIAFDRSLVSKKILIIGFFRSKYLYSTIQRIRFIIS